MSSASEPVEYQSSEYEESPDDIELSSLFAQVRRLEIRARRNVQELFAGEYQSVFKGQGMTFADYRLYQPGDEVRWIDWNVSARMDDLYVKQFIEERERTVMLLWDASASMDLATIGKSKRTCSAELGMLLALSAVQNNDRVGLILFTDKVEISIAPKKGRNHVLRLIHEILRFKREPSEQGSTDLSCALQYLQHVAPRHTIVFVLSDFLADFDQGVWRVASRKHEVTAMIVRDPLEMTFSSGEPKDKSSAALEFLDASDVSESAPMTSWFIPLFLGMSLIVGGFFLGDIGLLCGFLSSLAVFLGFWSLQREKSLGTRSVRDLETGKQDFIDFDSHSLQGEFEQEQSNSIESLLVELRRSKVEPLLIRTEQELMPVLLGFFRRKV